MIRFIAVTIKALNYRCTFTWIRSFCGIQCHVL